MIGRGVLLLTTLPLLLKRQPRYGQFGRVPAFVSAAAAFVADARLTYHSIEQAGSHGGGPWPSACRSPIGTHWWYFASQYTIQIVHAVSEQTARCPIGSALARAGDAGESRRNAAARATATCLMLDLSEGIAERQQRLLAKCPASPEPGTPARDGEQPSGEGSTRNASALGQPIVPASRCERGMGRWPSG